MTKPRASIIAVTDRVGEHLSNGAQVFADALLTALSDWFDVTAVVHAGPSAGPDRPYRLLESGAARAGKPLSDWLSRSIRDTRVDLIYNLGATSFACSVSSILAQWYARATLINHFQVNLASYASHEGADDEQIRDLAAVQRVVAARAARNVFPSFAEMHNGPLDAGSHDGSCVVVNPFVDAGAAATARPARPFTFFAAGRFSDYVKGADLLFRAFAGVHRSHPDARLETASDQTRFADLLPNGASAAWSDHGWLDRRSLHEHLRDADVAVVPSRYEPFGMVALEAMAMGTPVIAMDVGGLGEIIHHGHTGWLTRPDDGSLGLRSAMEEAIGRRAQTHRMGRNARRVARTQYALPRVAAAVRAMLDNAMRDRGARPGTR